MESTKDPHDNLTVKQASREYQIPRDRLYELVKAREIPSLAIGRKTLIPRWVLHRWIAESLTDVNYSRISS